MKKKFLNLAHKLCDESTAKCQRMACVIVKGGAVLSVGVNRLYNHAERRALRPHVDYSGATAYVMRHNKGCSRPCPECKALLIKAGISRAVYINWGGVLDIDKYSRAAA